MKMQYETLMGNVVFSWRIQNYPSSCNVRTLTQHTMSLECLRVRRQIFKIIFTKVISQFHKDLASCITIFRAKTFIVPWLVFFVSCCPNGYSQQSLKSFYI